MSSFLILWFFCSLLGRVAPAQNKERADILISGGTVVTMDSSRRIIDKGMVAIRGDRIIAVGPASELAGRFQAAQEICAANQIVLPGLVNTHNHAPMVLFRGIADDMALMDWLEKFIFPAEARNVSPEFVQAGTDLACLEMIRSGTTTYADMYYFEDKVAETTNQAGVRGVLGQTILG